MTDQNQPVTTQTNNAGVGTAQPTTQNTQTGSNGSTNTGNSTGTQSQQTQNTQFDLNSLKTKDGKALSEFRVSDDLKQNDPELVDLIMKSESMDDGERQYWFNLTEVMNTEQVEKLRGILTRERQKLAEIEEKYGRKKEEPKLSPEEIKQRNEEMARRQAEQKQKLAEREAAEKAAQAEDASDILGGLDEL